MTENGQTKEVVILFTDMVQYSKLTQEMRPAEIRDFATAYFGELGSILDAEQYHPLTLDPSAGDGAVIILESRPGCDNRELCTRALDAALALNRAIDNGRIPGTRMGLFLGEIIEAKLGGRLYRFGSSFAVASRLEELCGYYDTPILMDREMARKQLKFRDYIVSVGKVTPKNFTTPYNLYSIMIPGVGRYDDDIDHELLMRFIAQKNEAMDLFCGNLLIEKRPDFPEARDRLHGAQQCYQRMMMGRRDQAVDRIIEYIREYPFPEKDFKFTGIKLDDKKGDAFGIRLFHLSKQLLRAIDNELYSALVADTDWEHYFKLEWHQKGAAIVKIGEQADGIYYIDSGLAHAINEKGECVARFTDGSIFGEMAYYNKDRVRNATVIADSDVVLRKVSNDNFEKLPVIKRLFYRLARKRQEIEISKERGGKALSL